MRDKTSQRCGKGNCEHYDMYNPISGCKIYNNRTECSISMKQLKRVKKHSQKYQKLNWSGV